MKNKNKYGGFMISIVLVVMGIAVISASAKAPLSDDQEEMCMGGGMEEMKEMRGDESCCNMEMRGMEEHMQAMMGGGEMNQNQHASHHNAAE